MSIKNIIAPTFFICLILPLLSFSETIKYDKVKLKRAEIELIEDRLLDVGIFIFDPNIPEDIIKRYQDLINERNSEEGPWGSIEKSLIQIDKLLDEKDEEESQNILKATKLKIESMKVS